MNRSVWILVMALGGSLILTGCSHKSKVSTSDLQRSFKSAEPAMQSLVDKAVSAIQSNNYPEALGNLQVLSHKARLTPDQQQSIEETIAAIQQKTSSVTNKPAEAPQKKVDPLQQLMRRQQ